MSIVGLRPFVPARDFSLSKRFYQALGFELQYEDDSVGVFARDGFGFLLQNFYVQVLADNFVVQLLVENLDAWWTQAEPGKLADGFGVRSPVAPVVQPWGLKVGFLFDPSGVLWQVTQAPA